MTDIATWLGQQLDEDERVALGAHPGPWVADLDDPVDENVTDEAGQIVAWVRARPFTDATRAHVARYDPPHVLRVAAALRAILAEHPTVYRDLGWLENGEERSAELPVCGHCVPKNSHYLKPEDVPRGACQTVRAMAAIYDDRPGFKDEWRL